LDTKTLFVLLTYSISSAAALLLLRVGLPKLSGVAQQGNWLSITAFGIYVGMFLYGSSLVMWLWIVSRVELGIAYPAAIGLVTVLVALGSYFLLHENFGLLHGLGALLILSGVTILYRASSV
jgi:drug/metabolite transporter (DMT)-like permease